MAAGSVRLAVARRPWLWLAGVPLLIAWLRAWNYDPRTEGFR